MISMETAVAERLGYLQRHKDMATFKIAALQKQLEDSVTATELEAVNKQYTELTEKYRDMLERSNSLVARSEETSGFEVRVVWMLGQQLCIFLAHQVEVKHLQDENNSLKFLCFDDSIGNTIDMFKFSILIFFFYFNFI